MSVDKYIANRFHSFSFNSGSFTGHRTRTSIRMYDPISSLGPNKILKKKKKKKKKPEAVSVRIFRVSL